MGMHSFCDKTFVIVDAKEEEKKFNIELFDSLKSGSMLFITVHVLPRRQVLQVKLA